MPLNIKDPEADRLARQVARLTGDTLTQTVAALPTLGQRKGEAGGQALDLLIVKLGLEIVPMTAAHAGLARRAFGLFGKGQGGKAGLNSGDCIAHGLAGETGAPLLSKGEDFTRTDIETAAWGRNDDGRPKPPAPVRDTPAARQAAAFCGAMRP